MGGAPVSGFTNRQIYNTFGASVESSEMEVFGSIYTKNGTDMRIESDPIYNSQWTIYTPAPGETAFTIIADNPGESFKPGLLVMTSVTGSFDDPVIKGYSYSGVLQMTGMSDTETYFIVVWNAVPSITFQILDGTYLSRTKTPTPVISTTNDGKFSISCSDSEADIYWTSTGVRSPVDGTMLGLGNRGKWIKYDPTKPILEMHPETVIHAGAVKAGQWVSALTSTETARKIADPEFSQTQNGGVKYMELSCPDSSVIPNIDIVYKIGNGGWHTYSSPIVVNTNDYITAYCEKRQYADSNYVSEYAV